MEALDATMEDLDASPTSMTHLIRGIDAAMVSAALTVLLTALLVYVGWRQAGVSERQAQIMATQAELMGRQIEEARLEAVRAHRPRLHVRNLVVTSRFVVGRPIEGRLIVANRGGRIARVKEAACKVLWNVNGIPSDMEYGASDELRLFADDIPGGTATVAHLSSAENFWKDPNQEFAAPVSFHFYILGTLRYEDEAGTSHRTTFCRRFLRKEGTMACFHAMDDPGHEYEE